MAPRYTRKCGLFEPLRFSERPFWVNTSRAIAAHTDRGGCAHPKPHSGRMRSLVRSLGGPAPPHRIAGVPLVRTSRTLPQPGTMWIRKGADSQPGTGRRHPARHGVRAGRRSGSSSRCRASRAAHHVTRANWCRDFGYPSTIGPGDRSGHTRRAGALRQLPNPAMEDKPTHRRGSISGSNGTQSLESKGTATPTASLLLPSTRVNPAVLLKSVVVRLKTLPSGSMGRWHLGLR